MTEKQFREHVNFRIELTQMLESEVMRTALAIIEDKAKPRGNPEPRPNAHLDTLTTQRYCKLQGIQFAIDKLRDLTEPNPVMGDVEEDKDDLNQMPYFHGLPPEVQEAYRKMRDQKNTQP